MRICQKYNNRHSKIRLDRIAKKYNVNISEVIAFVESQGFTVYNMPPKGSKKDRLFICMSNGIKVKKHFEKKYKIT